MQFKTKNKAFQNGYLVLVVTVSPEDGTVHEEQIVIEDLDDLCAHFKDRSIVSLQEDMKSSRIRIFSLTAETAEDISEEIAYYRKYRDPDHK